MNKILNASQSLYLDFLRSISCIIVVFHHYDYFISKERLKDLLNLGQEAVMVFFVLSGFIISYISINNEKTFQVYISKRISRFLTVLIPAVVIHIILYYFSIAKNPDSYSQIFCGNDQRLIAKVMSTFSMANFNLLTTNKLFLPGGSTFWSLTCEWWYYVIYAVYFYFPNRCLGYLVIGIATAILGPPVMLLFPVWILGNITQMIWRKSTIKIRYSLILAIVSPVLLFVLWQSNMRFTFLSTAWVFGKYFPPHSTYFPYFWIIGLLISLHIVGALNLLETYNPKNYVLIISRLIKPFSCSSFFTYVCHLPIMICLKAYMPQDNLHVFIPYATVIICLIVGPYIENMRFSAYNLIRNVIEKVSLHIKKSKFSPIINLDMKGN